MQSAIVQSCRSFLRRTRIGTLAILGLIPLLLLFAGCRFWAYQQVEKRLSALEARGFPVTLDDLNSWDSQPGDPSAALLIASAGLALQTLAPEINLPQLSPLIGFGKWATPAAPLDRAVVIAMMADAALVWPMLEQLYQLRWEDEARYPNDFTAGHEMPLPHLSAIRTAVQWLCFEAVLRAETGESQAAGESLLAAVAAAKTLENEPLIVSQSVRISSLAFICGTIERVLNRIRLSTPALADLIEALEAAESPDSLARALAGERCLGLDVFRWPAGRMFKGTLGQSDPGAHLETTFNASLVQWQRILGTWERDLAYYLDFMENYWQALARPYPERFSEAENLEQSFGERLNRISASPIPFQGISSFLIPGVTSIARSEADV
jgi:hypothetical protein